MVFILAILFNLTVKMTHAQVRNFEKVGQEWQTDLSKHSIELNELKALLKRDGIPPIDHPKFLPSAKAKAVSNSTQPSTDRSELNGVACTSLMGSNIGPISSRRIPMTNLLAERHCTNSTLHKTFKSFFAFYLLSFGKFLPNWVVCTGSSHFQRIGQVPVGNQE